MVRFEYLAQVVPLRAVVIIVVRFINIEKNVEGRSSANICNIEGNQFSSI